MCGTPIQVVSAFNGKVLYKDFKGSNKKHEAIGQREVCRIDAKQRILGGVGSFAVPYIALMVDGFEEWKKARGKGGE